MRVIAVLLAVAAAMSSEIAAQSPDSTRTADERGAMRLGSGGDATLTLGGYVQVDGRWVSGAGLRQPDGLFLRRARLIFDVAMPTGWHLRLQPDFGQGRVLVQDAYVGRSRGPFTLRAGRFRPAFGLERAQSSSALLHPERSVVNSLMPSRSFGAQLLSERGRWRVALGGFRTPIGSDAVPVDTDGDVDARAGVGYDLLLRAVWSADVDGRYTEVQAGLLRGAERGTLDAPAVARVLSVAQQPILVFRGDGTPAGTVRAAGTRMRSTVGALTGTRTTVLALEGALFTQRVEGAGGIARPSIGAVTARVARVWNGTRARSQEVTPNSARGAFEVGARVGAVGVWGDGLGTLVTAASATHARTAGTAFSWVPTTLTRVTIAYDVTVRRGVGVNAPTEHALMARWQQGF